MNKSNNFLCEFLKYAIIALVFLVPFSDLVIAQTLYFPFITGKGFIARAIVIVISLLYTALVTRDKSYLPKKSAIVWSATAFIAVLLIATINSIDPWKSFWSNQERMEGFATLFEMFVLFIAASGVFGNVFAQKSKEKNLTSVHPSEFGLWNWFLNTMLVLSILVGAYAYSQLKDAAYGRIFGTLGNSSYLGGYAMVHFFLAMYLGIGVIKKIILFFKSTGNKINSNAFYSNLLVVILYFVAAIFNLFIVYQTGTRGSFVGLIAGLSVMAIIWSLFEKKLPLFRWIGIVSIIVVIASITFLGVSKNQPFIKNSYLLSRFSQLITWDIGKVMSDQGHSRSMIWGMAYKGVLERPVLGWGQDNFPYVFAKYYDPAMYAQEQWFDRTHNVFFDWLIAAGFLGLLAYLILFLSAIYTLWKKVDDNWSVTERAVLTGMFIAYFAHNFFVFDNLASYIFFFTILAFINTRGYAEKELIHKPLIRETFMVVTVDVIAVVLFAYIMWISVLSPYASSGKLIQAMQDKQRVLVDNKEQVVSTDPKARFNLIKSVLDANDLTRSEARERLVDIADSIIIQVAKTDPAFAKQVYDYTVNQYAEEMKSSKMDPRPYYFYSIFQQKLGLNKGALETMKQAVSLSPTKQSFIFSEGQLMLMLNQKDESVSVFKKAYELDKTNAEALKYYAYTLIENNRLKDVDVLLDEHANDEHIKLVDPNFNKNTIWSDPIVTQGLMDIKAYDKAISIAKQNVANNPKDVQALISLSAIYLKSGDRYSAIETLKTIKTIQPGYTADVDKYIKDIQDGKDPSSEPAK